MIHFQKYEVCASSENLSNFFSLVRAKNKITSDFHILKRLPILKHFAGTFQETQTSNF